MLDHSAGMPPRSLYDYHAPCIQYNKRGPRVTWPHHPLSIPISSMDLAYTELDLPPFMDLAFEYDENTDTDTDTDAHTPSTAARSKGDSVLPQPSKEARRVAQEREHQLEVRWVTVNEHGASRLALVVLVPAPR